MASLAKLAVGQLFDAYNLLDYQLAPSNEQILYAMWLMILSRQFHFDKDVIMKTLFEIPFLSALLYEFLFIGPTRIDFPAQNGPEDRKSTRLNSSHSGESRMPSSA